MSPKKIGHKLGNVVFHGLYSTPDEGPEALQEYGNHRDHGEIVRDQATEDFANLVEELPKDTLSIVDFGGGGGKMYNSLKHFTSKNYSYKIIELPGVVRKLGDEVKYFSSTDQVKDSVDVFYTDASFHATQGIPVVKNIENACKLSPEYIVFHRSIVCEGGNYESFYTLAKTDHYTHYYNILKDSYFQSIIESYGYELVEKGYARGLKPPGTKVVFEVVDAPEDIGTVCYKQYIFKRKS